MKHDRRRVTELRGERDQGWGVSDLWQIKDLQTVILEVWQTKGLAAGFVDLWQIQDLVAFLEKAEICAGRIRKAAWRVNI